MWHVKIEGLNNGVDGLKIRGEKSECAICGKVTHSYADALKHIAMKHKVAGKED